MAITEVLFNFLSTYPHLISFLAAFLGGSELVLALAFFAAQGAIHIITVMIFAFLGILAGDMALFYIGRIKFLGHFKRYRFVYRNYKRAKKVIERSTDDWLLLTIAKTIRGVGLPIMIYLGRNRKFGKFIKYDIPIAAIWAIAIVSLGWLAGKGYYIAVKIYDNIQLGIILVGIVAVIAFIAKEYIQKLLLRKEKLTKL